MRRLTVVLGAGVGLAVLAGCGQAVPDSLARDYAQRHATGSHLVNEADVPVTYSVGSSDEKLLLQPGDQVTNGGGAWMVPQGWRCQWKVTGTPDTVPPTTAGSQEYDSWTTFGGYDETIVGCTPPA